MTPMKRGVVTADDPPRTLQHPPTILRPDPPGVKPTTTSTPAIMPQSAMDRVFSRAGLLAAISTWGDHERSQISAAAKAAPFLYRLRSSRHAAVHPLQSLARPF